MNILDAAHYCYYMMFHMLMMVALCWHDASSCWLVFCSGC